MNINLYIPAYDKLQTRRRKAERIRKIILPVLIALLSYLAGFLLK